jgi:hypothetical protein
VTAAPYPAPAPAGFRWERKAVDGVQVLGEQSANRKCAVYRGPASTRRSACNATAVALDAGRLRCAEHLRVTGVWIEMGVAWEWALARKEEA